VLGAGLDQRDGAAITELAETTHRGDEQLAIEALLLDELLASLGQHGAGERRVEGEGARDAGETLLVGRATAQRRVDLLAEALDDLSLERLGLSGARPDGAPLLLTAPFLAGALGVRVFAGTGASDFATVVTTPDGLAVPVSGVIAARISASSPSPCSPCPAAKLAHMTDRRAAVS